MDSVYNLVRVFGRVCKVAEFPIDDAKTVESKVLDILHVFQVDLTKTTRALIRIQQLALMCLVVFIVQNYNQYSTDLIAALLLLIGRLSRSFSVQVKIGISKNTANRVKRINKDISSGYTEWHLVPAILFPLVPFVTWTVARPHKAIIFLSVVCFFITWIAKTL